MKRFNTNTGLHARKTLLDQQTTTILPKLVPTLELSCDRVDTRAIEKASITGGKSQLCSACKEPYHARPGTPRQNRKSYTTWGECRTRKRVDLFASSFSLFSPWSKVTVPSPQDTSISGNRTVFLWLQQHERWRLFMRSAKYIRDLIQFQSPLSLFLSRSHQHSLVIRSINI